jgi:hypothetical protein
MLAVGAIAVEFERTPLPTDSVLVDTYECENYRCKRL